MGAQLTPLFQAVEDRARRYRTWTTVSKGAAICQRAYDARDEIAQFREYRKAVQHEMMRVGKRNGAIALLDMHPVEYEAAGFVCPEFVSPNAERQREGLRWLEKQDFMGEFLPPKFEKRRF